VHNPIDPSEENLKEKLQVLDHMNTMLKTLKSQFVQNEQVSREVFKEILDSDFESVLVNMREEYSQVYQSNRQYQP